MAFPMHGKQPEFYSGFELIMCEGNVVFGFCIWWSCYIAVVKKTDLDPFNSVFAKFMTESFPDPEAPMT